MKWEVVPMGDFLKYRDLRFKPNDNRISNLKRIEKIDFSGNIILSNKNSNTDMILIKKGDLVISGINVEKGASAVYKGEDDITATIHYSSYEFDEERIDIDFLQYYLRSEEFIRNIKEQVPGGIKTEIKPKHILPLRVTIPIDVSDQRDIVFALKSHFQKIGNYESENNHQLDLLKKLRQHILQDAIKGKLVPQDPNDEPARKLLERIKSEKEKLIQEKKIKKEKPLPDIKPEEIPFEIPENWVWCRLGDISTNITKGSSPTWQGIRYVKSENDGILFITSKNVGNYNLILDELTYVEKEFNNIEPRSILKKGDLLTNIVGGSIGRTAMYNLDKIANINQAVCLIRFEASGVDLNYFLHLMNSDTVIEMMFKNQFAPGRANLSMSNISTFPIPLPPLPEQQRIVSKIEQLMKICNELEQTIMQNQKYTQDLLQVALKEALESKF